MNEEFRYGDCLDMKVYIELFTIGTRKLGTRGRSISKTKASGQIHELGLESKSKLYLGARARYMFQRRKQKAHWWKLAL